MDWNERCDSGLLDDEDFDFDDSDGYELPDYDEDELDADAMADLRSEPTDADLCRMALEDIDRTVRQEVEAAGGELSLEEIRKHAAACDSAWHDFTNHVGYNSEEFLQAMMAYHGSLNALLEAEKKHPELAPDMRTEMIRHPIGHDNPAGLTGDLETLDKYIFNEQPYSRDTMYDGCSTDYVERRMAKGFTITHRDNAILNQMLEHQYEDDCIWMHRYNVEARVYEDTKSLYETIGDGDKIAEMKLPTKYSMAEEFDPQKRHFDRLRAIVRAPGIRFEAKTLAHLTKEQRETLYNERIASMFDMQEEAQGFIGLNLHAEVPPQPQAEVKPEAETVLDQTAEATMEAEMEPKEKDRKLADAPSTSSQTERDKNYGES